MCERPSQLNAVVFIFAHCFSMNAVVFFAHCFSMKSMWVSNISETLTEFELLKGEEEDPFFLEEGLQETIVLED